MKNKQDGIEIKAEQVWGYNSDATKPPDHTHKVIGFHNNMAVTYCKEDNSLEYCVFDGNFTLLKSHNGADLEQARKDGWKIWIEGLDKPDPLKIEDAHFWSGAEGRMKRREVSTSFYPDDVYFYKPEPSYDFAVTMNGKPVNPKDISKETWMSFRGE